MFKSDFVKNFFNNQLRAVSAETVGWIAVLFLHCATIPALLGFLFGVSDKLPSMDVVIFVWSGLVLMFIKALISKDMLNIITISVGFMVQAGLLGVLLFK